jgi:hypothetical protein
MRKRHKIRIAREDGFPPFKQLSRFYTESHFAKTFAHPEPSWDAIPIDHLNSRSPPPLPLIGARPNCLERLLNQGRFQSFYSG